ncbi:type VI secretion protein [Erythrobacter sp. KY5]|uniref:type IV secretion system protein n=1 Tax=Erythrobacter sp. KY5 TaxID=2011159 RepID=UPI000DBF28AB|nr:type IV secretion system protein [Erythrobacter sp. KY5]AWW75494.1 type VI secretion protein [Erythrobacter sp. KY5]
MTTTCDLAAQDLGTGVAAALTAVDCIASEVSEQAFNRLFGAEGQLGVVLTVLLTMYVAFFGFSLMLGRSNLSVRAVVPKMMTIGLVLTFATSFAAFQTVFYNLVVGGPDQIAGILTDSKGSATATFATKLDIVFLAVQEASTGQTDINLFSPPGMMWAGAMMLLLGTVGLLVTARIGIALLLAVGPIFVVLALFNGTRGLFVGWLKGLVMLALGPLFAVVGGSIMLELAVPILAALVAVPGQIDQQAAMGFFVVGFVHVVLMLMALLVSAVMVAKWEVFGFARPDKVLDRSAEPALATAQVAAATQPRSTQVAPTASANAAAQRRIDVNVPSQSAANDTGSSGSTTVRETKVFATSSGSSQSTPGSAQVSRTRGIGNRFRSAGANNALSKPEKKQ